MSENIRAHVGPSIPDYILRLAPYVPGKPIDETKREFGLKEVIKLASNENPLGPSPKALAAMRQALGDTHLYPDGSAFELKQKLSRLIKPQKNAPDDFDPSHLIIGSGSNEIIELLIRAYCVAGDSIATSQLAFVAYQISAQIQGVTTVHGALKPDYTFDLRDLLNKVVNNPKIKMVFLPNPNNPTGTYVNTTELETFIQGVITKRPDLLIVLDYAYWEYVTAKDLPDPLSLYTKFPQNVVILRTFSKIYGLAGLRIGYGIAHPAVARVLEKVRMPFNVNSLALKAATAALEDSGFVHRSQRCNQDGLHFWRKTLDRLEVQYLPTQGNFILADVQAAFGKSGPEIQNLALKKGVIFRPIANYGHHQFLRISVGTQSENKKAAQVLFDIKHESNPGAQAHTPKSEKPDHKNHKDHKDRNDSSYHKKGKRK